MLTDQLDFDDVGKDELQDHLSEYRKHCCHPRMRYARVKQNERDRNDHPDEWSDLTLNLTLRRTLPSTRPPEQRCSILFKIIIFKNDRRRKHSLLPKFIQSNYVKWFYLRRKTYQMTYPAVIDLILNFKQPRKSSVGPLALNLPSRRLARRGRRDRHQSRPRVCTRRSHI